MKKLKLLFITPKIHEQHDDFAFTSLWARAFSDAGFEVMTICMEKGESSLPFPVYSMGKEDGLPKWRSLLRYWRLIIGLKYDRVFVHMSAPMLGAGCWWWWLRGIPTYFWYTHYTQPMSLKIGGRMVKRMFCAMKGSLPQYEGDPRKVVTGHGIDTKFWDVPELLEDEREPATHLLAVHRISRSKRLDLLIKAMEFLPAEYTLTHYGRTQDPGDDVKFEGEIKELIAKSGLENRVKLMGSVPMPELRKIYPRYRVIANMVPQTIDKSAIEAMYCGLTPVLARDHAAAIGLPSAPKSEDPKDIADYILNLRLMSRDELRRIIDEKHSLASLVQKMSVYIREGN